VEARKMILLVRLNRNHGDIEQLETKGLRIDSV
jgi:hypothetical protein